MRLLSVNLTFGDPKQYVSMITWLLFFFYNRSLSIASAEASAVFRQQMARTRGITIYARYNGRMYTFEEFWKTHRYWINHRRLCQEWRLRTARSLHESGSNMAGSWNSLYRCWTCQCLSSSSESLQVLQNLL